jgi:hypothetical protein
LLGVLEELKGKFLLSSYRNKNLTEYIKRNGCIYAETATGHTIYLGAERGKWNIDAKTGTACLSLGGVISNHFQDTSKERKFHNLKMVW